MKCNAFSFSRAFTYSLVRSRPFVFLSYRIYRIENPEQYDDAAVQAIREVLEVEPGEGIPTECVECVKMGTTVATNALLERKGEPTLLVVTKGFRDVLRLAYQNRPRIFDRHIQLHEELYEQVVEVDARVDVKGNVIQPLDEEQVRLDLEAAAKAHGLTSVAIALVHGYKYPFHEEKIAQIARLSGFSQVSTSHETVPLVKIVGRGDTTVVDAYLSPILGRYVKQVSSHLKGLEGLDQLQFMQSNGGLSAAEFFKGKDAILSGPAGGIVAAVKTAREAGHGKIVTFDMG